jgi:hypothetical protein
MTNFLPGIGRVRILGNGTPYGLNLPVTYFNHFVTGSFSGSTSGADSAVFSTAADVGDWRLTTGGGSPVFPKAYADEGGWMTMTNGASNQLTAQINGAAFRCQLGKKLGMALRVNVVTATAIADFFGMAVTGATDPYASRPAGFIGFTITGTTIEFATANATTATASVTTGSSITAATAVELAFEWDGVDTVSFFIDGLLVKKSTLTIPIGLLLSPVICADTSAAGSNEHRFDYIMAWAE